MKLVHLPLHMCNAVKMLDSSCHELPSFNGCHLVVAIRAKVTEAIKLERHHGEGSGR